jgi:hypothetical protein
MATDEDVTATLRCSNVDQGELEQLFLSFFGSGAHPSPKEITHGRQGAGVALRVLYNNDGKLQKVLVGPNALPDDVEQLRNKIDAELLTDGQLRVRRQVLFSSVPANGYFRYKDRFQIIPVPQEAPRPGQFVGQHPFILEYAVRTSPDFMITSFRQRKLAREVELVLSTLLYLHVFSLGSEARKHWVIDYQNDEVALPSKFLQEGYAWHGSVADAADFSATKGTQPMASLPIDQYYGRPGLSVDSFLDVPANLTPQLDKFYALNTVDCDKFLRASYWFQHANTVFTHSKSASFVALVSAIEAIMPEREGDTRCPECNSHIGPSITKRFVDLVESLIPDSGISEKDRKRFYWTRSALAHGGKLLAADHNAWSFTPKALGEDFDVRNVWRIVRAVLHNWLAQK